MSVWRRDSAIRVLSEIELFPKRFSVLETLASPRTLSAVLKEAVAEGLAEQTDDGYLLTDAGRDALAIQRAPKPEPESPASESDGDESGGGSKKGKPTRNLQHFEKWLLLRVETPVPAAELPLIIQEKFEVSPTFIEKALKTFAARGLLKLSNLPDGTPAYVITEQRIESAEEDALRKLKVPGDPKTLYQVIEDFIVREQRPMLTSVTYDIVFAAVDLTPYERFPGGGEMFIKNRILNLVESGHLSFVWSRSTKENRWGLRHVYLSEQLRGSKVPALKMEEGWQEPFPTEWRA